jgi:RNA polymerase sigma-70 factor (ECF subfamily)
MSMAIQPLGTRSHAAGDEAGPADAPFDAAAFGALYDRYLPKIYAFIGRRVEERSVAEAITASTFERALKAAQRRDLPDALIGVFLYRVAANAVVDHSRRARRQIPPDLRASDLDEGDDRIRAEAISDEAAARAFGSAVDGEYLRRALVRTPEGDRRVILLSYFDGLEPDELAAALGCNRAEVGLKLHRALRVLRTAVTEEASNAR